MEWFTPESFVISVEAIPGDGGTVTGGGTYVTGSTATVTATAGEIYEFVNWTEDGTVVSDEPTYSFTVTSNRALEANFAVVTYTVTAAVLPAEGGSVTGAGSYVYGAIATLTATPATDYTFINWTADGVVLSTEPELTITVQSDTSLVAHFESQIIQWEVTLNADPEVGGTVTGAGIYASGTEVTVTAEAANNFRFDFWKENGEVVSTEESYTFSILADRALTAHFTDVTATKEVDLQEFGISPNPATEYLTIQNRTAGKQTIQNMELYNMSGNPLSLNVTALGDSYTIDMKPYAPGLYILKITLKGGDIRTFRVIRK